MRRDVMSDRQLHRQLKLGLLVSAFTTVREQGGELKLLSAFSSGVRPAQDDYLDGFQADFALLLGAGFADPDHATPLGAGRLFVEDKFDHLTTPQVETSTQPEAFFRGVKDEAGEPLRFAVQIDNQAGAPLQHHTLRAAALGDMKAGHSFNHWSKSSDDTPGLASFETRNDEPLQVEACPSSNP